MTTIQEKHHQLINRLKEKYKLLPNELSILESLKAKRIKSVSFTTDGGFHCKTGVFYSEDKNDIFKIRILYWEGLAEELKMVCLVSSSRPVF